MSERTPIEPRDIREGDLIRMVYRQNRTGAVATEYYARRHVHMLFDTGDYYLLHRPEPPLKLGWTCGGVIVSDVAGVKRDVADGIPWEHGDDGFAEGVLVPKAEWDLLVRYSDDSTVRSGPRTEREVVWAASELVAATRRINGGDDDE